MRRLLQNTENTQSNPICNKPYPEESHLNPSKTSSWAGSQQRDIFVTITAKTKSPVRRSNIIQDSSTTAASLQPVVEVAHSGWSVAQNTMVEPSPTHKSPWQHCRPL